MATKFSSVTINVSDGNTVPSIDFLDYPIFPDIGSGTVARLYWSTPTASGNSVAYYELVLKAYSSTDGSYLTLFSKNIGDINEFYITSDMLTAAPSANYKLYVYLTAVSNLGTAYNSPTSNIVILVCAACGTYVKVEDGYSQPIMKRTIAFAKLGYRVLTDNNGKALVGQDGKVMYGKASSVQHNTAGWTPMEDFYTKTLGGSWQASDIQYEVLTDANGEIVTDSNDNTIYTL